MPKKCLLLTILVSLLLTSGCWDLHEINASAIPIAMGLDMGKDKKISISTLFNKPLQPGEAGSGQMKTVFATSSDYGAAMAARRLMLSLSLTPDWAHVESAIFGENLVRNNLPQIVDFMTRNRNIRPDMTLFISADASPDEIIAQMNSLGDGLRQLISINEFQLGTYVPTTLGEFTYKLTTPGIEATVPQITKTEMPGSNTIGNGRNKNTPATNNKKEVISLYGTAVFKGGKMIGSLDQNESRGYRWLNPGTKSGGFLVVNSPLTPQHPVALEIIRFNSKTRPQLSRDGLKMRLEINAQLIFYEQTGPGELLTPAMIKKHEAEANHEITQQVKSCIKKSQQLNSDILGWGRKLQEYQPDEWKRLKSDWDNIYPVIEADIRVKTVITHTYLTNQSFRYQ